MNSATWPRPLTEASTATLVMNGSIRMRQFFITMLGTIAGIFGFFIVLFILFIFFGLIGALTSAGEKTPDKVLTIDLRQGYIDHSVGETLFGESPKSIVDTVYALNRAKDDETVKGVFRIEKASGGKALPLAM